MHQRMVPMVPRMFAEVGMVVWAGMVFGGGRGSGVGRGCLDEGGGWEGWRERMEGKGGGEEERELWVFEAIS